MSGCGARKHTIAALALLAVAAWAGPVAGQAAVGAKAGVSFSNLAGPEGADGITGLTAGGYFGLGVADRLAIQIEAIYSIRGADNLHVGANTLDPASAAVDVELEYLQVPLLLRTGFPGERFMPSFFVGPYVMFLLSCEMTTDETGGGDCDDRERTQWFSPRSTDYGLTAGAGLDYAIGESTVFLDLRYSLGLVSIQSGDEEFDASNTALTITGGFAIPLGR